MIATAVLEVAAARPPRPHLVHAFSQDRGDFHRRWCSIDGCHAWEPIDHNTNREGISK